MNQVSSSKLINNLNEDVMKYKVLLKKYLQVLSAKQSDCENELHQLVTNTSIEFSARRNRMLELMVEQEKFKKLIDGLEKILLGKGDTI